MSPRATHFALLLLLASLFGCRTFTTQKGLLEQSTADAQISSHQLRVLVNDFAVRFAARIEAGADEILARSADPDVRRNAILWKKNAIAASFRAATRPDPMAAYLDLWILNRQMMALFQAPPGDGWFGPHQAIAVDTCRQLEPYLGDIYMAIGSDLPLGEEFVATFAADFPVTNLYFDRESLSSRYVEAVPDPIRELYQVVSRMQENLAELQKLTMVYAEHVPKQARWEAELLLLDTTEIETIARPLNDFSRVADSVTQVMPVVASLPQVVAREHSELQRFVEHQRNDTMRQIDALRNTVTEDLRRERANVLDALQQERVAVSGHIDTNMARAIHAADAISLQRSNEMARHGRQLVDHFYFRTLQLGGVLLLITVVVCLGRGWGRRRKLLAPDNEPTIHRMNNERKAA